LVVQSTGNRYQVDPALAGRRVELIFDPFDLTVLAVRCGGRDAGTATPHHITRHAHPKARPETASSGDPPCATGIDYLALLDAQHTAQVAGRVNYAALDGQTTAAGGQQQEQQQDQGQEEQEQ
jgi:putative transposase